MRFRASEMTRLVACPGSKKIQQAYPNTSGYAATEGSAAHKIAANVLQGKKELSDYLGQSVDNVYADQEMLHHLQLYIDDCQDAGNIEQSLRFDYEEHVLTGTPDYSCFDTATATLKIKDLKYGYGWVEVFENWQLLAYAMLLYNPACVGIELTIIQPRALHPDGPVRRWSFNADLMRNYMNRMMNAMEEAAMEEPTVETGVHCRYCRGLTKCHAARAAAGYAVDYAGKAGHDDPTPETIALELDVTERAVKMLTQRQTALEESALLMCKKGTVIPGWEARNTSGALAWDVNPITVGDAMGVDLRAPVKAITPTQAVNRKLVPIDTINSLASRSSGGIKLKRVNHTRAKRILA